MKNPKKNQKTPFTRRQFVGSCAAGASMIGLNPLIPLSNFNHLVKRTSQVTNVCDKIKIHPKYSKGTITIKLTFPNHIRHKKSLIVDDISTPFIFRKFCDSGFITELKEGGSPELPYFGLLVHLPDCLDFDEPRQVQENINEFMSLDQELPMYPAQVDVQDNVNYFRNYSINARYDGKTYSALKELNSKLGVSDKPLVQIKDNGTLIDLTSNKNNFTWQGPNYIGKSKFYILGIIPILPDGDNWFLRSSIKIVIKNIRLKNIRPNDYFLDTPYLPKEFDRLPQQERIIDPWNNIKEFQKILPKLEPLKMTEFQEIGPDMIIFYENRMRKKVSDYLISPALRLAKHKRKHDYPNVVTFPINDSVDLLGRSEIMKKIEEVITEFPFSSGNGKFKIWRLNSIILLGDIPGIQGMDLYTSTVPQDDSIGQENGISENYFSDYCVSTPRSRFEINSRDNPVNLHWPDIVVGRIPAETKEEADYIINNIIDYETNNFQDEIFKNLTLVSYFQDSGPGSQELDHKASKDYLQCVEEIRLNLKNVNPENIELVYQSENPDKTIDKHEYRDGTRLDKAIEFLDNDEATKKILNAFNIGGRLIVHRDHGWMNGWAYPNFKIPVLWKIKNSSKNPSIVFNINCLSGRFTGENYGSSSSFEDSDRCNDSICNKYNMPKCNNDSFSEVILKEIKKPDGNRINLKCPAVVASTEVSPSFENDWLLKIMFDRIYGGILSGKPKAQEEMGKQRIGDVLNLSKILLYSYQGDRGMHKHENVVFHILGDPTLKL